MNVNILYQTALNLDWKHDKEYVEQENARKRQQMNTKARKMPTIREIELINKMKVVDKANEDLESVRALHEMKAEEFQRRWKEIATGQIQLKLNLVKYNNFIKEKQIKAEAGCSKVEKEKELHCKREEEAKQLENNLKILTKTKEVLKTAVDEKAVYKNFLDSVLPGHDIQDIA